MIFFVRRSGANPSPAVDWTLIFHITNIVLGVVGNVGLFVAEELGIFGGERSGFSRSGKDGEHGQEGCQLHFKFNVSLMKDLNN